jgi:hypothetical protein
MLVQALQMSVHTTLASHLRVFTVQAHALAHLDKVQTIFPTAGF